MEGYSLIEVKSLEKRYGDHVAVSDLSFTVEDGQIYGFLGPNGAGKTTTMNIMCGYIGATKGDVLINGKSIVTEPLEAKKQIGYLPELPPLYQDMTADEYLDFVAHIKGIEKSRIHDEIEAAVETAGIGEVRARLLKNLSKGYRQRVGLAQAVLGMPPIIILDEPTVGLDPKQIIEIRELIKSLGKKHTVILSSHILSEVSSVCDKVMIISNGRLVACDTPERLEDMLHGGATLSLTIRGKKNDAEAVIKALKLKASYKDESPKGTTEFTVTSDGVKDIRDDLFFAFAERKVAIISMTRSTASLEEVFLNLTSDESKEAEE